MTTPKSHTAVFLKKAMSKSATPKKKLSKVSSTNFKCLQKKLYENSINEKDEYQMNKKFLKQTLNLPSHQLPSSLPQTNIFLFVH